MRVQFAVAVAGTILLPVAMLLVPPGLDEDANESQFRRVAGDVPLIDYLQVVAVQLQNPAGDVGNEYCAGSRDDIGGGPESPSSLRREEADADACRSRS